MIPLAQSLRFFFFHGILKNMLKSIVFLTTLRFAWDFQMPSLRFYDNSPRWSSGLLECATAGNAPADREETGTAFLKPY